jgi:hypothetical protein
MTSPFEKAEFLGGPLDGQAYERRGGLWPRRLEMSVGQYVHLYVAGLGRLGQVVYRHRGRIAAEVVA